MKTPNFVHLNVHSHYSILNGCSTIQQIVDSAIKNRMLGIAITDYGNMFGIMEFIEYVAHINKERHEKGKKPFKPIIGCELYVAKHGGKEKKEGLEDYKGYHLTILAKNLIGYKNLIKIVSNAWTDGFYVAPRTDQKDLEKYHEGLVVLSGGWGSEVFTHAMKEDMKALDDTIKWYRQVFGDDYYFEIRRDADYNLSQDAPSGLMIEQEKVNKVLIQKSKEYGVKVVATNDVHYVNPEDLAVYNIQQCILVGKTMEEFDTAPLRFRWLTSKKFMTELFSDYPEAISNTMEIFDKVETYDIHHAPIMPPVSIPEGFKNDTDYLEQLTYTNAKVIYRNPLPEEVVDRLQFELEIIKKNGAERYFLFIQNVVNYAEKELGALVGPGRGSAAGSLVCYCLGITKIDPLKHDLLFERFLSPKGTMFPDIDIDFDDEGRERVLEWLQQIYDKDCCAHIVSFSTHSDDSVLKRKIRGLGIHASGFIVANEPITNWAPIATVGIEDSNGNDKILRCVQYDGRHVESSGLIKFDFIGCKTLSKMREICMLIKTRRDENIHIDTIPIDDEKTMKLFQSGQTEDVFLFDSQGMQKFLRDFQPTCFEDLVILNCMYRPGPMEDISKLIKHKKSKKGIKYIIPCMEKYLHNTYGIIVYQEQIMMLSRLIANFDRGESDLLRKALGKRKMDVLSVLKPKFIEGGMKNGHKKNALEKVWNEMEYKGMYAFNKSHAVCYTWLAYQMAYLKAHYLEEFKSTLYHNIKECNDYE